MRAAFRGGQRRIALIGFPVRASPALRFGPVAAESAEVGIPPKKQAL
jgi:hypothetical protein